MLARAFTTGVSADWVVGDTVYGYDELRLWLDEREKNYVLAVPETHAVWVNGRQEPVGLLAALLPPDAWVVLSAGEGSKGPRLYEWAWLQLPEQEEQASPEAIAPAPEAASILAQLSPASSDAAVIIDSTGSGEVQEAIPWRRGFLAQLLRRGRNGDLRRQLHDLPRLLPLARHLHAFRVCDPERRGRNAAVESVADLDVC